MLILLGDQQLHDLNWHIIRVVALTCRKSLERNSPRGKRCGGIGIAATRPPVTGAVADIRYKIVIKVIEPPVALRLGNGCCRPKAPCCTTPRAGTPAITTNGDWIARVNFKANGDSRATATRRVRRNWAGYRKGKRSGIDNSNLMVAVDLARRYATHCT
jgi:hypothetical protein